MTTQDELEASHSKEDEENISFETFQLLCKGMAEKAGVTMEVTDTAILFSGVVENVDLRYTIPDGLISIRSRDYCPGYEGTPDARWFIVQTIQDHIGIAMGEPREGPDWRQILDREEARSELAEETEEERKNGTGLKYKAISEILAPTGYVHHQDGGFFNPEIEDEDFIHIHWTTKPQHALRQLVDRIREKSYQAGIRVGEGRIRGRILEALDIKGEIEVAVREMKRRGELD